MARELLTIGGAIVGSFFGMPQIGFMLGSLVGNIVDPQVIKGPKLNLQPQTSRDGVPRPIVFGTTICSGNVIDRGEPVIKKKRKRQGKGGPVVETQHVYMTYAIRICKGEITGLSRIWQDDKIVYDVNGNSDIAADSEIFASDFTLYTGSESHTVDPDLEIVHGVGTTPLYKGTAYIVFPNHDLTDFGGRIPQYRFEVVGAADYASSFYWSISDNNNAGDASLSLDATGRIISSANTNVSNSFVREVRALKQRTTGTGKFYFEIEILADTGGLFLMGLKPTNAALGNGSTSTDAAYWDSVGGIKVNNTSSIADNPTAGDVIGVAVDMATRKVWFSRNGTFYSVNTSNPAGLFGETLAVGTYAPWFSQDIDTSSSTSNIVSLRLLSAQFDNLPSGFSEWGLGEVDIGYNENTAQLDDIVTELCSLVGVTAGEIDVTDLTDTVDGFLVQGDTVRDNIQALQRAYFFDAAEFDNKIHFIKRGGASVVSIPEDDLLTDAEEMTREQELEFPKKLHLYYHSPALSYVPTKATSERASPDIRVQGEGSIEIAVSMTQELAAQKADILHKIQWIDLIGEVKFKLPELKYAYLVPSNIVTVTIRGKARRLRIEKIERADGIATITARHDRASAYTSTVNGATIRDPLTPVSTIPGESLFAMLNINAIMDSDDQLGYRIATGGTKAAWPGTVVQRSIDAGSNYTSVATVTNGAVMGLLTASLPDASPYFTDTTNTLSVELQTYDDELETITDVQLLQDYNAAVITDGTNYEIVQFKTATFDTGTTWDLTTLLRGRANTEPRTWDIGDTFALLETTDFIAVNSGLMGQEFTHRSVAMGTTEASATEYTETFDPINSCREWAPYGLTLARDGGDVITGEWIPRWRIGTSINPVQSVNFIGWRVTLDDGVLDAVTFDVTTPEFSYDASALGSPLTVSVAGINRFTGAGDTASDTV